MTLEECKIYLKTMGYYTPTRVDFTKTYHSAPKIHGLSIECVDFGWSPHGVHGNPWGTVKYRNSPPFAFGIEVLHKFYLMEGIFWLHHCAVVCCKSEIQQKFSSFVKQNLVPVLIATSRSHDPKEKCMMGAEYITKT